MAFSSKFCCVIGVSVFLSCGKFVSGDERIATPTSLSGSVSLQGNLDTSGANTTGNSVPSGVSIEAAVDAFEKRARATSSFRAIWTNSYSYCLFFVVMADEETADNMTAERAEELRKQPFIEFSNTSQLTVAGVGMRFEDSGLRVWGGKLEPQEFHTIDVTNGTLSTIWEDKHSLSSYPYARTYRGSTCNAASSRKTFPVRACLMPLQSGDRREIDVSKYAVADREALVVAGIDAAGSLALRRQYDESGRGEFLLLDPEKQFNVRAFYEMFDDSRTARITNITHAFRHDEDVWGPSEWQLTEFDEYGNINFVCNSVLTTLVRNTSIGDSEFEYQYSPGTLVEDQRAESPGDDEKMEASKTEELIQESVTTSGKTGSKHLLLIANAIVLTVLLFAYLRHRRARGQPGQ